MAPSFPRFGVLKTSVTGSPLGMVFLDSAIAYGLCAWSSLLMGRQGREVRMYQKSRSTNYALVPQDPRDIIKGTAIACLAVAIILGVPQIISYFMQAWS